MALAGAGRRPAHAANGFSDHGDVVIKARMAADILGCHADGPTEWTTVHTNTCEVFCN